MELTEYYDEHYLKKLSNITHKDIEYIWTKLTFRKNKDDDDDDINIKSQTIYIRNLCKKALENNNSQVVDYKYSKKNTKSGRLYSKSSSFQNIPSEFRGLLGNSTAIDFDIQNCHPCILKYLCKKHSIGCDILNIYINNRDNKLIDFMDDDDLSKGDAKILFLKSINYDRKIIKKDKKTKIKNKFFLEFDNQIKQIQKSLCGLYKNVYDEISKFENNNITGKTISRLLNTEEGIILEETIKYLQSKGYVVMTRCFDGLFIKKEISGNTINIDKVITLCEEATKEWNLVWVNKNHNISLINFIDNLNNTENVIIYSKTETDLVKDIYNYFYKDILFKANGNPYLLVSHQWINNINTITTNIINNVINTHGYVERINKDNNITYQLFTQNLQSATSIVKLLLSIVPENKQIILGAEKRSLYNISFNNGYWDFKKCEFIKYSDNDNYDTINMIDREFEYIDENNSVRKELFDNILYKMFCIKDKSQNEFKIMEDFLYKYSRAMCGIISDKIWFYIMGGRDSCKGVFDTLMRNSFGEYIGNFNTSSLELETKNSSDMELKQKFILKNRYCRLAISQEISDSWLDGDLIKKVSSGGDRIDARNLYSHTETFQNVCKYALVGNADTRVKPSDALSTRWYYEMKSLFVDDINNIKDKLNGFTYYKKNDDIKQTFIYRDDVKNAMCSILFDYYKRNDTSYPKVCIKLDDANVNPFDEARLLFDFTDKDARLSNNELKNIYNKNKDSFDSFVHMKKIIKQLGCLDYKDKERGLKGCFLKH